MAELVQAGLESMLTELEQLQRIHLLSQDEVKALIKRRKHFEYLLQKRQKMKEDILSYIQYESSLLSLIAIRREQMKYSNKKGEIDYAIARRINKLFKILEHRFSGDLKLWSSHIAFLKKLNWKDSIGKVFKRMLQVHPDKEELWIAFVRFEVSDEGGQRMENARTVVLEALRFHPKSLNLYLESFCLEIAFAIMVAEEPSEHLVPESTRDSVARGDVANAVFRKAKEAIDTKASQEGLNFISTLLDVSSSPPGRFRHLQNSIAEYAVEKFPGEPLTWKLRAILALQPNAETNIVSSDTEVPEKDSISPSGPCPKSAAQKISECCSYFEEGLVKHLPVEVPVKRQSLLSMYLGTLLSLLNDEYGITTTSSRHREFLERRLCTALKFGKKNNILTEHNENLYNILKGQS